MPLLKKDDIAPERPVIIVIYAPPGVGKTSLANTAKKPILIDCDRGFDRAAIRAESTILASTWEDVLADEAVIKEHKTVIIDTAKSMLDDFLSIYVCNMDYKLKKNKLKMYGEIGDVFKGFVNRRRAENVDIVFVCHAKEEKDGDITKVFPDVTGQSKDLLLRIADQVGYMQKMNGKRVISFDPTETHIGKNVAEIPTTTIPDRNDPKFLSFMDGIINNVRDGIKNKTEEQRQALARIEEAKDAISALTRCEEAEEILKKLNEMPSIQQKPLKMLLLGKCKTLNIVFDKENGKFKLEEPNLEKPNLEESTQK